MKILSYIPARGGSKGIHRKNIQDLNGFPLLAYTISSSLQCDLIQKTIVSSDDKEILKIAKDYGANITERPKKLSEDDSRIVPGIRSALIEQGENGYVPDYIILNQPTSPFRLIKDLENSINLLSEKFDAVMSISLVPAHYHPIWNKKIDKGGQVFSTFTDSEVKHPIIESSKYYYQRQQLVGDYYWKNGAIYIMSYESVMNLDHRYGKRCAGYIIPQDRIVNIDQELDLEWARFLLKTKKINLDFNLDK